MAYGLEETLTEGWAVECFMCKSKGPFAFTPEEAIHRYSPWVAFSQRPPMDGQRISVWDEELGQVDALGYHARIPDAYAQARYTHWAPALLSPAVYLRVTDTLPELQGDQYAGIKVHLSDPPDTPVPQETHEQVADARADATLMRDNDFDDDIPFSWAAFLPFIALLAHVKTLF
jgi:hypothetical protein